MQNAFKALWIEKDEETGKSKEPEVRIITLEDLADEDVTVRVDYSTINFKDGLAITGKGPIVRSFPMIPGVDMAGEVVDSESDAFKPGDAVIVNGFGLGETHKGAFTGFAKVKSEWLVPMPDGMTAEKAMSIGTAGLTSMLCVMALEQQGLTPDRGPVLVTGAAGGVGSVATAVLSQLGFHVIASTGRTEEEAYLKSLGASEIIDRDKLSEPARPLGKERWAGVVDAVGSHTLANAISQTMYNGVVTACGLAQGGDLPGFVHPFILRGVKLIGVESVMAPIALRKAAYDRLVKDLDTSKLASVTHTKGFHDIIQCAHDIMGGKIRGRVVIDMKDARDLSV
jgi:acrylyl-CoA reductase (NADPH)